MADFEQLEFPQQQTVNGKVPLGNSYSEFKRVDNAYVNNDSTVGRGKFDIFTLAMKLYLDFKITTKQTNNFS